MTELFPVSIANNILSTIAFLSSPDSSLPKGLTTEIEMLKEHLCYNKMLLLKAEGQRPLGKEMPDGLAKLSDLLYRAEDVLDDLKYEMVKPLRNKVSKKISDEIKSIRKGLEENVKSRCYENMSEVGRIHWGKREINRTFSHTPQVFGRMADRDNIIQFLMEPNNNDERVSVISIAGGRGMGKSTLAKLVYKDERIDERFNVKMWVYAPANFALAKLLKETYISVKGQNQAELTVEQLENGLNETLYGKRFLLVLDNVSDKFPGKWQNFKDFLTLLGATGSKIVVTTRSERVAEIMGSVESYVLQGLSVEDSTRLFVNSAFRDGEANRDPRLSAIGAEIVSKCGGVPLAVKTLGALLNQNTNESDWVLIRDSPIWRQGQKGDSTPSALELSHAYLPSHLQRCLAYCSLFPDDYRFTNSHLIQDWMALGFLTTDEKNKELEDVGLQYLNALFCFFQDVEDYDYYSTFKMHDFIHDLVFRVTQDEPLRVLSAGQSKKDFKKIDLGIQYAKINIPARHLSISGTKCNDRQLPSLPKNLRTIIMRSLETKDPDSFVNIWTSKFKYLRLLSLCSLQFKRLPNSVGTLKHLRCLDLSWNSILVEISEAICELQSLQTLRLLGCSGLGTLTDGHMQKMSNLLYLEITMKVESLPQNGIIGLKSLQFLKLYECRELENWLRMIPHLSSLKKLVIFRCFKPEETQELPHSDISRSAESSLEYMRIEACHDVEALPWLTSLTSIKKLEIVNCPKISSLPDRMQELCALRTLKIQNCYDLSASWRRDWSNIFQNLEVHLDPEVA